jgi:uncharacterized protein
MFARKTLALALFVSISALISQAAESTVAISPKTPVKLYPLSSVRLLESPFSKAAAADREYVLALDPDRLLAPFRTEAGLQFKKPRYGNWESQGLAGHTAGHYLSALANLIASGDDKSGELRKRLDYMIDELQLCQQTNGDGYVGGVPDSKVFWKQITDGHIEAFRGKWVPWYNMHKVFAGLRDAYLVAGNEKARTVLIALGDWCEHVTAGLSDDQMQRMLGTEQGGMNETLADIYAITGNEKYLKLSRRFNHQAVLGPLEHEEDHLTGLHANTQIPKVIGLERIATLSGDKEADTGARYFWDNVTGHRTVAFGGNSVSEHFNPTNNFQGMLQSREGPETCNTYNMLRLTEQLFASQPRAAYADYYERALYNHILATIDPDKPGFVYFTPLRPEHYRVYSEPDKCFWCCVGTGMENPGRYGQFIYGQSDDGVFVNLFIPSELTDTNLGLTLRQETKFPDEERTRLVLRLKKSATFTLHIRHPSWVAANAFSIRVNGKVVEATSAPSSYLDLNRKWSNRDTVEIDLPMRTTVERLPDGSDWVAILRGPIVLASPDGTNDMRGFRANDSRMGHVANGPMIPMDQVPVLLASADTLPSHIVPAKKGGPMAFKLVDVAEPAAKDGITLLPFFRLQEQRYQMYWQLTTKAAMDSRRTGVAAEERSRAAREAATLDSVAVGEQQSEVEHDFSGDGSNTGIASDRRWRDGRSFQYTLATRGERAAELAVTYFGGDSGRTFDIVVNGVVIATETLKGEKPNEFFERTYPIAGQAMGKTVNGRVTVKFVAKEGMAGGIFGLRLIRPDTQ